MKLKNILFLAALALPMASPGQTTISFETEDYQSLGVYDTWEESPFRTGKLSGNVAVVDNPFTEVEDILGFAPNTTSKILGVQRSRFGSNTFGVRVDLSEPFELTTTTQYVHVLVHRPYEGRVMVVGLGKRRDRSGQSPETEQFWAMTTGTVAANRWQDVVLGIKGNGGIDIHSLVIVPDCESPHNYASDGICYVDEIVINTDATPRFNYDYYPTNFDKGTPHTRSDRKLNAASLVTAAKDTTTFTLPATPKMAYNDLTHLVYPVKAGTTLTTVFNYTGNWMNGYVYMDTNDNGKFEVSVNEDGTLPAGSELMAYSNYQKKNSTGASLSSANVLNPPAFTVPADLPNGIYRMRFKVDWDCVDAGGNTDANNLLVANGGDVADILVNVHGDSCHVSTASRNGEVITVNDEKLNNYPVGFGEPFTIKMRPENGFEYAGIIVKHGYNLNGDSIQHDNRQWKQVRYSRELFTEDHQFTLPAECMDGDVEIEGLFIEEGTWVPEQKPTRFQTTVVMGEFPDTTTWYTIQIGSEGYVISDNATASYIALNHTEVDTGNPAHLWCFTGNDEDGYCLYNQQAGPAKVLAAPTTMLGTTGADSYPTMQALNALPSGYTAVWNFLDSSNLGSTGPSYAYMYEQGYVANKVNNRNNKLAFWNGGQDAGSTLRVFFAYKGAPLTGIIPLSDLGAQASQNTVYDLYGRRVSRQPAKGIYVVNGKKVYVK